MMLFASESVLRAYETDGFSMFIVFGEPRIGKSVYALIVSYEVYGNWNAWKKYMVFTSDQFLKKLDEVDKKQPLLIWDDAGAGALANRWRDSEMEAVIEEVNTIGTKFAGLIITTPLPEFVLRKIRMLPGAYIGMVTRTGPYSRRIEFYRRVVTPNTVIRGLNWSKYEYKADNFDLTFVPQDVYKEYAAIRERYHEILQRKRERKRAIEDIDRQMWELKYKHGWSLREIAKLYGITHAAVLFRLKKYEQRRQMVNQYYYDTVNEVNDQTNK